jgi:AcrR family transcriptional regulator
LPRRTNTRERLITTAAELFRRQGYAQTGVNEIMQQARTTSGSFYHFFPTKEDLLLAVVDHVGELLETEVFGPAEQLTTDPFERVITVAQASGQHLVVHEFTLGSSLGTLAAELSESHPGVRRRIAGLFNKWVNRVRGYFEDAEDRLPVEIDRNALARFVLSAVEGAILQSRVDRNLEAFDATVAELRRHFSFLQQLGDSSEIGETHSRPIQQPHLQTTDWRAW